MATLEKVIDDAMSALIAEIQRLRAQVETLDFDRIKLAAECGELRKNQEIEDDKKAALRAEVLELRSSLKAATKELEKSKDEIKQLRTMLSTIPRMGVTKEQLLSGPKFASGAAYSQLMITPSYGILPPNRGEGE